jgi:hypothetical protein
VRDEDNLKRMITNNSETPLETYLGLSICPNMVDLTKKGDEDEEECGYDSAQVIQPPSNILLMIIGPATS